uniref:Homeobox-leucine zipper protein n=1 Tax=Kalanchoe fedtschenkoi TaxID=63787 RepID=A0A7N0VLR5_KALFE
MAAGGSRVFRSGNLTSCSESMAPVSNPPATASSSRHSDALFLPGSSRFPGSGSAMVSFEDVNGSMGRNTRSFFTAFDQDDNGDEDYEEYLNQAGKKRRLSVDQVQFLERSFEAENKLEPDRKIQLAKELGLQPRQVAIWFQNRRARWKTKQMEKDYDALQASYNSLKSSCEALVEENENLKAEVVALSEKLASKENPSQNAEPSEASKQSAAVPDNPISNSASEEEDSKFPLVEQKLLDDFTSAKSDIFQSDSPRYADGVYSPHLEHVDSSYVFEPDNNSDLSQDEDDSLPKAYLPSSSYMLPPLKHGDYPDLSATSSSNFGSAHGDHQPFWSWSF